MTNNSYVYLLIDSRNNKPFYCGLSTYIFESENREVKYHRAFSHIKYYKNPSSRKEYKINSILNSQSQIDVHIVEENLLKEDAINLEVEIIKFYGRLDLNTGILCNHTNGGEGTRFLSDEIKRQMSISMQEAWKSRKIKHSWTNENRQYRSVLISKSNSKRWTELSQVEKDDQLMRRTKSLHTTNLEKFKYSDKTKSIFLWLVSLSPGYQITKDDSLLFSQKILYRFMITIEKIIKVFDLSIKINNPSKGLYFISCT
jgi:hypothetical protein